MMDKLLKKVLYTGIGIVASTTERLQKAVDELVSKGKISEDEGKKVVEDVVKNTETKKEEYESRFRKLIDTALAKINMPQGDSYEKLEKRIKSLEVKLGLLSKELEAKNAKSSNPTPTSSTKKTSRKKTETAEPNEQDQE